MSKQDFYKKNESVSVKTQTFWRKMMLSVLTLLSSVAFAQQNISGTVTDGTGFGLPGVTVAAKGTTIGTQTDMDGKYKISVPTNSTLVFSFVGMLTQEIVVGNSSAVNVKLLDDTKILQEVVVIGYGTQKKKDLTGSIASVTSEDFVKGPIVNPEQLVSGKIAGVQITTGGGAPGSGSRIRIRGGSSLNASNDPLIVIDGVPVDNNSISGAANPLSFINPNDIESFTVLKDASAAAIYGSRASNGVIIINTKKGRSGDKLKVSFSTQLSSASRVNQVDVLTGEEYRAIVNERGTAAQKKLLGTANTDWQDEIYRTAFSQDNNLSVSGSIKKVPVRASVGFLNQNGILKTSNMKRTSLALGINPKLLNDHLKVDISLKSSFVNNVFANQGAIGSAVGFDPTQTVNASNEFGGYFEWLDPATKLPNTLAARNPLGLLMQRDDLSNVNRSIGNIQLDYKIKGLEDLRANLNLGFDNSSSKGTIFVPANAASAFNRKGINNEYEQTKNNKLLEFYLNYAKDLSGNRLDLMAGYSWQDFIRENPAFPDNDASGTQINPAGLPFKTQNTLVSFFGRANYTYKDKYLLTFTLRNDGSSRFSPETRWGLFPSAALAWKVKEESFMKNSKVFDDLKIRLGYGVTGQQDVFSDYPYLARYTSSDQTALYQFGNTFYSTLRPEGYDANIKWEETTTYNAGLDFAVLKGRIMGSFDIYNRKTKDLLSVIPVPAGSNLTNQILTNVGNLENKGVEFSLNTTPIKTKDFTWDLGFNITYNENVITNLSKVPDPNNPGILTGGISGGVGNTIQIHTVGFPTNTFYIYKQVYNEDGTPIENVYEDLNGDGKVTPDDRYRYKSPNSDIFLGASTAFNYKNWSMNTTVRGNIGNYMYNNLASNMGTYRNFVANTNYLSNILPIASEGKFSNNQYFSDYYIENASFLRMDNLSLGYNLGKLANKINARLSANIQNVFYITKYSGLDPEIAGGVDNNIYPRPRTYTLGINLDF